MQEPSKAAPVDHAPIIQSWSGVLNNLKELSASTIKENIELTNRVKQLEEELQVWRLARSTALDNAGKEKRQYEDEKTALQKRIIVLESMQGSMVLCVLDGDGNIFADRLVAAGLEGGREAARNLKSGIWDYLKTSGYEATSHCTFWLSIYFNRKGLQDTLVRKGVCSADQFEAFLVGISQASPRFLLIDVGYGKEAADAKIKEYLQTYTRFPQTLKVFFGGAHDNGYLPTLTALENERLLDKIVLLTGYRDVATELKGLNLATLTLDSLFRSVKLVNSPAGRFGGPPSTPASATSDIPAFSSGLKSPLSPPNTSSTTFNQHGYSTRRKIDPNVPLRNLHPRPCNNFYLLGRCNKEESCDYGHDYELAMEHINQLKIDVKKTPCKFIKNGQRCSYGPNCIMGHICPNGPQCKFFREGRCRFKSIDAHTVNGPTSDSVHSPVEQNSRFTVNSLIEELDALDLTIN